MTQASDTASLSSEEFDLGLQSWWNALVHLKADSSRHLKNELESRGVLTLRSPSLYNKKNQKSSRSNEKGDGVSHRFTFPPLNLNISHIGDSDERSFKELTYLGRGLTVFGKSNEGCRLGGTTLQLVLPPSDKPVNLLWRELYRHFQDILFTVSNKLLDTAEDHICALGGNSGRINWLFNSRWEVVGSACTSQRGFSFSKFVGANLSNIPTFVEYRRRSVQGLKIYTADVVALRDRSLGSLTLVTEDHRDLTLDTKFPEKVPKVYGLSLSLEAFIGLLLNSRLF